MANVKYLSDNDGQVLPVTRDIAVLDENGVGIDSSYQKRLVSGVNIKTINSHSLLGNGDIPIPKGEDAVNPFKGFYYDPSDAPEGDLGDYIFVPDGTSSVRIYTWDKAMSEWEDTGIDIDPGALAEFQSGERVSAVTIDNTSLETPATNSIPKATDVKNMFDRLQITDSDDYDFAIGDGSGYNIAEFSGGGIRTKNFDSASMMASLNSLALLSINKFSGKKISIIGDSISTYSGYLPSSTSGYSGTNYVTYYPYGDVNSVNKMWWAIMAENLGVPLENINPASWSGSKVTGDSSSTSSASAGCSTKRITDLAIKGWNPDIVICFISCNDFATDVELGSWSVESSIPSDGTITTLREAYALMLYKIHATYPNARVFACTCLDDYRRDTTSGWPCNNGNGVSMYTWNMNIREVSNALGVDIIELHQCGLNYQNIASMAVDTGLHPNAAGHRLMAQKITAELIAKY